MQNWQLKVLFVEDIKKAVKKSKHIVSDVEVLETVSGVNLMRPSTGDVVRIEVDELEFIKNEVFARVHYIWHEGHRIKYRRRLDTEFHFAQDIVDGAVSEFRKALYA